MDKCEQRVAAGLTLFALAVVPTLDGSVRGSSFCSPVVFSLIGLAVLLRVWRAGRVPAVCRGSECVTRYLVAAPVTDERAWLLAPTAFPFHCPHALGRGGGAPWFRRRVSLLCKHSCYLVLYLLALV